MPEISRPSARASRNRAFSIHHGPGISGLSGAVRRPLPQELRALIRRMAAEIWLWGQKRIQAELARLGFKVSARTVAKYMAHRNRGSSPGWRKFLKQHAPNIWACDFFCVHTILFQTLYVFFVIRLANREVLHVEVTRHPTAEWAAQQIVECRAWDRRPSRFLIHDRDSRYGMSFDRRVRHLGIGQARANALAERWVKSAPTECLDRLFVIRECCRTFLFRPDFCGRAHRLA